jgi:GNAT superfamily N-acetyltransferase
MPRVKTLKALPKFRRSEDMATYRATFRDKFQSCEQINSAKVCDDRRGFKMLYCERRKCHVAGEGEYLGGMAAYLAWYGVEPAGKGIGKKYYQELESWLSKKRCIKRIALHAASRAEPFWLKMGFRDVDKENFEKWWNQYDLRKLHKPLTSPKSCTPEKAVGGYRGRVRGQLTLDKYKHG